MTKLSEVQRAVEALTPKQLSKLAVWLHKRMDTMEPEKRNGSGIGRRVLKEHKTINKTYQLKSVRCGKNNCHCADGKMHGPYWYTYCTEGGRTKSQYIGKKLPRGVMKA